ncbi:hypothetical protein BT96DRAFT_1008795 [Gymnopus androsaceus JB14]|uniref:Uncharacterized protein n=1 Tax=Gymnopus androsaceus JB14 TaxID=1447944 RepID=A0A6A4GEI7_9AGAR|nr:hypothetical protein BT96DRAFT_1008795 [Gymnopus androsaceus JB14]
MPVTKQPMTIIIPHEAKLRHALKSANDIHSSKSPRVPTSAMTPKSSNSYERAQLGPKAERRSFKPSSLIRGMDLRVSEDMAD